MPPNILLIMADDQRFDFMPYMPNVRNLIVFPGRDFTNCRCNVGLCQPTRASFFTGQWSKRHHVVNNGPETLVDFDHDNTVAAWIHATGYRTGLVGKYLNGADAMTPPPAGWDTWRQLLDGPDLNALGYQVCDGSTTTSPPDFQMEYLKNEAITFLGGSQPWFLMLAATNPHIPLAPDPRDLFAWSDVRWPLVVEDNVDDKPSWISGQPPLPASALANFRDTARGQLREGTALDRAIGEVINSIPPAVLANTYVVYCSDNGLVYGEHRMPFQGIVKNTAYDPGLRVALAIRGPGVPAGTSPEPVSMAADLTTTFLGICGGTAGLTGDGVDLLDVIATPATYASRHLLHSKDETIVFGSGAAGDGITTPTRKLYRYPGRTGTDRFEAYDLDIDPNEFDNWANDVSRLPERNDLEAALDALLVV